MDNIIYLLVFFVGKLYINAQTFEGCSHQFSDVKNDTLECDLNNFYSAEGDTRRLTFCFMPRSSLQFLSVYILANSSSILAFKTQNFLRNSRNKLEFSCKRVRYDSTGDQYRFEMNFKNETFYSNNVTFPKLKTQKTRLQFHGAVTVPNNFFFTNSTHLTNCEERSQRTFFRGCSESASTENPLPITICYFDNFYPIDIGGTKSLNMCFKPGPSFNNLTASIFRYHYTSPMYIEATDSLLFKINDWNDVALTITKKVSETFEVKFQNTSAELPLEDLQQVQLTLFGNWRGSRNFTSGNGRNFTNCIRELIPTLPPKKVEEVNLPSSSGEFYFNVFLCSFPLAVGVMCISVGFILHHLRKKVTARASTAEITMQEVNETSQGSIDNDGEAKPYCTIGESTEESHNQKMLAPDLTQMPC